MKNEADEKTAQRHQETKLKKCEMEAQHKRELVLKKMKIEAAGDSFGCAGDGAAGDY